jgi:tyrosine phenol-lyase
MRIGRLSESEGALRSINTMKTIIEPFKIKVVEQLRFTTRAEREQLIKAAHYNPFLLHSDDVLIDLLTDSGTTAMSAKQWSALMDGDEAYAGSRSYYKFEDAVRDITGFKHIIPTHQGRAAEKILFGILGEIAKVIPNNTHFDTTRANIEASGARAIDLPNARSLIPELVADFKGDMDIAALEELILREGAENVPVVMLTITNNTGGGQPVSMKNIREVSTIAHANRIPFYLDACRFAENAMFIKLREEGYANVPVKTIAQEMFSYADGCTMSAKKDGLVNTGGWLAMNDDALAIKARNVLIVTEGFTTYGGLARRDLEAIARGLVEVMDETYLAYRLRSIQYLGDALELNGVPIVRPTGGHAVYLDAKHFAPHIPQSEYPGQSIVCALYLHAGIRCVEVGSVMFGKYDEYGNLIPSPMELVRLAIPRRVYTQSHIDYVAEAACEVFAERESLPGLRITYEAPVLRHFTAHFEPNH